MNGNYLLDTNIIIALFAADDAVVAGLRAAKAVFVPSIALGELFYDAHLSSQPTDNIAKIEELRASSSVLACDSATALHYGEVKADLKRSGRPIPENDIWIAALARQHELTVVSRDQHFVFVTTVVVESW